MTRFYIQDQGAFIPTNDLAQAFAALNFKQINSLGIGTDTLIPIVNPDNPSWIADIQTQDLWGFVGSGTSAGIYRLTNVGIGLTNPRTTLHVNGNIIGYVASGSGILYTTYGALSSSQVLSYNNNLLGYNLRGWVSSVDGGGGNNNFYAMNTASFGFSGIEQAYGGAINFYTCNTAYQSTTTNATVTPRLAAAINPGGVLDAKYGVIAPRYWTYSNSYTADSTWGTGWQTIIPPGTLGGNNTYIVHIFWNYNSAPSAGYPYYLSAATLFATTPGTNGTGNDNAVALMSATHIGAGGSHYIQTRTNAGVGGATGTNGLQMNIQGFTVVSGTAVQVYVQQIGYG